LLIFPTFCHAQYECNTPTITSITPSTWIAGKTYNIIIKGTGFTTSQEAAMSGCPVSPIRVLQVTEDAGGVDIVGTAATVSTVNVVSSKEIKATVEPAASDPTQTACLTAGASAAYLVVRASADATLASSASISCDGVGGPYSAAAPVKIANLPPPIIQRYGKTVSGKTTTVTVGQPVELTAKPKDPLPAGYTLSTSTWTVDGTNIGGYDGSSAGINLTASPLNDTKTTFYWLYPDTGLNVTYTYCATDPDGDQICEASTTATATFNAKAASSDVTMSTEDSKEATIEQLNVCTMNNQKAPYLGYGNLSGPAPGCPGNQNGTVGIKLPTSGASGGKYVFVQVINADFGTYTYPAPTGGGPIPPPYICGPHAGLDKKYPFPGVYPPASPLYAYDGPQMLLPPTYASGTRNFYATMYLLWQPDQLSGTATKSIPVPIGYQDWEFIATALQKPPIGKDKWNTNRTPTASGDESEGFVLSTQYDNALYGYPQWSYISSTSCGVSQTIDTNVLNKYSLWNYIQSTDNGFSKEEQ
jgi:hypothetical protein